MLRCLECVLHTYVYAMFDFMLSAKLCKQISFVNLEVYLCAYDVHIL